MNIALKTNLLKITALPFLALITILSFSPCVAETSSQLERASSSEVDKDSQLKASVNQTVDQQIENLTSQIAKLDQELIRLNTKFRIECTSTSKWKPWRLFLYNLGGSGSCVAGSTSITATRWHYWHRSNAIPIPTAAAGPTCLLIGHCIVLAGVLTETAFDFAHDRSVRQKGLDLNTSHRRVMEIKSNIDRLMAQREECLAQLPLASSVSGVSDASEQHGATAIDPEIVRAEGEVLKDLRSLALDEYAQFYARAHRFFGARDTNTIMALSAAASGGFGGSLPGIISATQRRPRAVAVGGIGFPVSGALIEASPIVVKLVAQRRGKNAYKQINTEFETLDVRSVHQLDEDRARLERLVSQKEPPERERLSNLTRRLGAYSRHSLLFAAQAQMTGRENGLANKELTERTVFSTGVGGTKISWGVNLANAGFGFHKRSILQLAQGATAPRLVASSRPGRLFTKRVAIGATTYLPGTSLWLIDTLQGRIRGELRERELVKQKIHPNILLKERQDLVQEIDDAFNY